jgi:hypothetical protein
MPSPPFVFHPPRRPLFEEKRVAASFLDSGVALCILLFISSSVSAGPKQGQTLQILQDASGVAGGSAAGSESGFTLRQTYGVSVGAQTLSSASGLAVAPGLWGGTPVRPSGGRTVVTFGDPRRPATLTVEPGALPTDWILFAGTSPATSPLAASAGAVVQANENLSRTLTRFTKPLDDRLWEIVAVDGDGRRYTSTLRAPATLSLPFRDDDGDGLIDDTVPPVRVAGLAVWWLDEEHSLWVKLPDSRVDRENRAVTAPIRHFSVFTVMGVPLFSPGDAHAFPVPWRPFGPNAGGGPGQTGTLSGGITFTNLPSLAKIRVYSLVGDLVKEIDHSDGTPQRNWDVRNDAGDDVQSGTYIYVIESNGSRKTGKLVIVR